MDKNNIVVIKTDFAQTGVTDLAIDEMAKQYMPLTIVGINDKEGYKEVKKARLYVRRKRLDVDKKRKELKDEVLKYGRAVDRVAREITEKLQPIEAHLYAQEKRIDAQRAEMERKAEEARRREMEERERKIREAEERRKREEEARIAAKKAELERKERELAEREARLQATTSKPEKEPVQSVESHKKAEVGVKQAEPEPAIPWSESTPEKTPTTGTIGIVQLEPSVENDKYILNKFIADIAEVSCGTLHTEKAKEVRKTFFGNINYSINQVRKFIDE